jgi:transposase
MMNLYSAEVKTAYHNEEIIIIMDQAGWHKSKDLVIPDKIEIAYLPPYSPDLKSVERFWNIVKIIFSNE